MSYEKLAAATAVPELKNLFTMLASVGQEDTDAYQFVVKEEEKGIGFYEGLADQAKDEEIRKSLLMIVAEERKHLSIIENIYSFVESPTNFLAWGEFSNLKEYL